MSRLGTALAAVVLVVCMGLSAWAWYAGPCELYRFAKAGEVPARCLMK